MNDRPIHLPERSVTCPVWITQENLDGLQALIKFLEGYEAAGKGTVSGSFELTMFYRQLRDAISEHYTKIRAESNQ